ARRGERGVRVRRARGGAAHRLRARDAAPHARRAPRLPRAARRRDARDGRGTRGAPVGDGGGGVRRHHALDRQPAASAVAFRAMLRTLGRLIKNELVTGMVLLAPVAGTAYLVYSIVRGIDGLFPDALRPRVLGVPLPG